MAVSRLISRPGPRVPRLLTVSRLPDKIASARINIVHERAHRSVRLHPAATTATAVYATAFGGTAATSTHSRRGRRFTSGASYPAGCDPASTTAGLHAAF